MNARVSPGLTASVALVGLGVLPGVLLADVVPGGTTVVVAAVAAVAAAVLATLAGAVAARRGRGVGALAALVSTLVAAASLVALAAWRRGPAVDGPARRPLGAVLDALTHGWAAVATAPVPGDASPRTLVPIAVVTLMATAAAVAMARRRAFAAGALLPGAIVFIGAAVAAGRRAHAPTWCGAGLLVAGAAYLAAAQRHRRGGERRRPRRGVDLGRLAPGVLMAAVAVGAAVLVGPALTFGRSADAFDPRDHVATPSVPDTATNPLDLATGRRRRPDQPMFTLTTTTPITTRLVALDTFDGVRWTTAADYRPTGSVITMARRTDIGISQVRATVAVAIDGLTGPWLPSFGDPTRIAGAAVLVDETSGSFIARDGDAAGARYTLDAEVPGSDLTTVAGLDYATDRPDASAVPGGAPAPLEQMAEVATEGGATPLARAQLLERYLRLNFRIDDKAATGQSYGHVLRSLTEARAGTEEEFSIAFAVLGRLAGLPTRLVVGFGPGTAGADGTYAVRSGDARVWPEVKFDGAGWLPFDPVPARNPDDDQRSSDLDGGQVTATLPESPDSARPVDGGTEPIIQPVLPGATPSLTSTDGTWRTVITVAAGVLGGVVAIALVAAVAVIVLKRRRTARRRHAATPAQQVTGAWHDVLDRLVELGVNRPAHRTVEELVEETEPLSAALAGIYRPVSRALYDDRALDEADAAQAWRARDRFASAARRSTTTRRRLQALVDPRPLFVHHRLGPEPTPTAHSVTDGGAVGRAADPVLVGQREGS